MNSRRRAAEALVCCGLPAAWGVCCPLCGRVARAGQRGKPAQDPTPAIAPAGGPAFPKPKREIKPRTNIRARNPGRAKERLERDFGPLGAFVRGLPCCVHGCRRGGGDPSDPAHVLSRGSGHHAWIEFEGVKVGNIAPLCRYHHNESGRIGAKTFDRTTDFYLALAHGHAGVVCSTLAEVAKVVGWWFEAGITAEQAGAPC